MMIKPYYERGDLRIYHGDCRTLLLEEDFIRRTRRFDACIADPPYQETALPWDKAVRGWVSRASPLLIRGGPIWCFGSLRFFIREHEEFRGWKLSHDIVWEKQNGAGFQNDRFKRVHELAALFYRGSWSTVYKSPVKTLDATRRRIHRRQRPPHLGGIEQGAYFAQEGGPRMMRSVLRAKNCHGYADVPTQKPTSVVAALIEYSCRPGGTVLDPFMGSGTTLVAAEQLGRGAVGIDADERCCEIAARRLAQPVLPEAAAIRE